MTTTTRVQRIIKPAPTLNEFLDICNGRARTRVFQEADYLSFLGAIKKAVRYARKGKPFYDSDDCGGVARAYVKRNRAFSAQWGVWATPDGKVDWTLGRPYINGNGNVPCAYPGGERAYNAWFRAGKESGA